ncbi:MAG: phospho-sugar mutase, partial [Clostridia bacterium]|nr:phospho-sugar mutase [Clostridia bacterium]
MDLRANIEKWEKELVADTALQAELRALAQLDPAGFEDSFYRTLEFGTAGMRGILGIGTNRMNVHTVRQATRGLALFIHDHLSRNPDEANNSVIIAYDSRDCSTAFAKEAALVLCASGIRALLFKKLCPVAMLSYAVRKQNAAAGICITASHNPREYNGYKVYWNDGAQLPPEAAASVQSLILQQSYAECAPMDEREAYGRGLLVAIWDDAFRSYKDHIKSLSIQPDLIKAYGQNLKIVYSPLYGSGMEPVCQVLGEMGISPIIVAEQSEPDGAFPGIASPNPEDPGALRMALDLAIRDDADVCFGTDPDCDRLGVAVRVAPGEYKMLTGNQIGCLLLHYILSAKAAKGLLPANGAAVKSIVSTNLARTIAEDYGVRMIDTLTGFKFIACEMQQMEETGDGTFLFGFEESMGFLSSDYIRDKDGVNASLLLAELALALKQNGTTLYGHLISLYQTYGYVAERNVSITYAGKDGKERMDAIMRELRAAPPARMGGVPILAMRDYGRGPLGTRLQFTSSGTLSGELGASSDVLYFELLGGSWVCIRPSGTEPKIKLY